MKRYIFWGIFLCVVAIASIVIVNRSNNRVVINKDESYFSSFEVIKDKVYIRCSVTVTNTYKAGQEFTLSANMIDDQKNGLLKEAEIYAYDEDDSIAEFSIEGHSQKTYDVTFVGDFAGTAAKQNRLLPDIEVIISNP